MTCVRSLLGLALPSLALATSARAQGVDIPFTKFTLDNGLQVVLHEDHSDPVVSVYVSYHVGSAREEIGRSGFAHLFEHMLFQGSMNVGDDQHFKMISEAGGNLNGTTNLDRTVYYETLPSNQLELALWLEADRMGFLLPAVTQEKLDNQREVVKNERRQNYENRPYAQAESAIVAAMYPPDHPYSWVTIGSQADLTRASLDDVHNFFRRWYGPNNATLAIGGDIKPADALALAKKYFGSVPRGPQVDPPAKRPAKLEQSKRLVMEDKVQLPQVVVSWPGTCADGDDDAALDMLAQMLGQGKSSILERAFRLDEQLARNVSASNESAEVAGHFQITITAAPGVSLDTLENKLHEVLQKAAKDGVSAERLERVKTRLESGAVRRLETVAGKTGSLANSNTLYGDPNHAAAQLKQKLGVTAEQVNEALRKYLIDRPAIVMSVVPQGKLQLAASGRTKDQAVAEGELNRTKRPAAGPTPEFHTPKLWHGSLANGVKMIGTEYHEVPLSTLTIHVPAGRVRESADKLGLASLAASLMNEGTRTRTTTELADELDSLGANINIASDDEEMSFSVSALNKNLPAAVALLKEVMLEPRFDAKDFGRIKRQRLTQIDTRAENIRGIASAAWARLMFGDKSIDGLPAQGTHATVEKLTLDDVKNYVAANVKPAGARLVYVGDLTQEKVASLLEPLTSAWTGGAGAVADASAARESGASHGKTQIFLVDKPGAAQSEIRIGHMGVAINDPDYYPLTVLNYILGGAFSSRINMNLRENKGYTYGARSGFDAGLRPGPFAASAGVHTQFTKESVVEFRKELANILNGVTEDELKFAKSALAQSQALQFESPMARSGLLNSVSKYGFADTYPEERLRTLEKLTVDDLKALAAKHLHPDEMMVLVVGDKAKVAAGLAELGLGPVIELDVDGAPKN